MSKNLVIVESPAKAKTIVGILGKDFVVKSSYGHVRDLKKKTLSIDKENNFLPEYQVSADKKKVIQELKKDVKSSDTVWLATDEDREGEAISWHLYEVLKLQKKDVRRITFNEITKTAIQKAVQQPREINMDLVNAQQARRVLDRLLGFELSPLLWKKIKPSLSAGRVQSVALRIIVDRENDIETFTPKQTYKVLGNMQTEKGENIPFYVKEAIESEEDIIAILKAVNTSDYYIDSIQKKERKRSASPPFTTSTLQQEASRKFGFSVSKTMMVAQRLYESGKITYMRTDSVTLSKTALEKAKTVIMDMYGAKYHQAKQYVTKNQDAQEAHEAIRPSYLEQQTVKGTADEMKLYSLIWKRTIASQMKEMIFNDTIVDIKKDFSEKYTFQAKGEILVFDGFSILYTESSDKAKENDKKQLPPLKEKQPVVFDTLSARQVFSAPKARYTEASLVRAMEKIGVGRPSTYAPTITTIQKREYVERKSILGKQREYVAYTVSKGTEYKRDIKQETWGADKDKLMPTEIGKIVTKFLVDYFTNIVDYNFTASVEKEFDKIAQGNMQWNAMVKTFYTSFSQVLQKVSGSSEVVKVEKVIGTHQDKQIVLKWGRYGQFLEMKKNDEVLRRITLPKDMPAEDITIENALLLEKLPIELKKDGQDILVGIGKYGPYLKYKEKFYPLRNIPLKEVSSITFGEAMKRITEALDFEKPLQTFVLEDTKEEILVLNGRYGPYIKTKAKNYKIPKSIDAKQITYEQCMTILKKQKTSK